MSFKKKEAVRDSSADEYTLTLNQGEVAKVRTALENYVRRDGYMPDFKEAVKLLLQFEEMLA